MTETAVKDRNNKPEAAAADNTLGLRREIALVPRDAISARALVTVIAIMTFLASLTAGAAILLSDVSQGWQQTVAREMSIQIKPVTGRNIEQDVKKAEEIARATPGTTDLRTLSKAESEQLLEPWLGTGLDLGELPVPRMIVLKVAGNGQEIGELLRSALKSSVPNAVVDDHKQWIERLTRMARTIVLLAAVIFTLVLTAMALAVAFATRGAMAGSREVINVLHFVGAEDTYIAKQFQAHFLWLGLRGGLIGGLAAIAAFLIAGALSGAAIANPGGEQMEALFGAFALGLKGYVSIAAITGAVAVLTGLTSRSVVFRHLQGLQ